MKIGFVMRLHEALGALQQAGRLNVGAVYRCAHTKSPNGRDLVVLGEENSGSIKPVPAELNEQSGTWQPLDGDGVLTPEDQEAGDWQLIGGTSQ